MYITDKQRPNIVFILADDMGYGDLTCLNPESRITTPNMDQIASEGMIFTDAHSNSAVCTPSRYGILTGRYCWRSRLKEHVLWGFDPALIEPDRLTLPMFLKQHGYSTACIGKWHLGFNWTTKDDQPPEREGWNVDYEQPLTGGPCDVGFDYFFGISASNNMPPYCFIQNRNVVGKLTETKAPILYGQCASPTVPDWKDDETGLAFTQKAVDFIEQHHSEKSDTPFFLYLASEAPHLPCFPAKQFKGKSNAGLRGDMVLEFDWTVSEVDRTLKKLGLSENTIFIITSDNGAMPGDPLVVVENDPATANQPRTDQLVTYNHKSCGELRGQKADIWDGGHRVPFILRWPGRVQSDATSDQTICLTDLFATTVTILGDSLPQDAAEDSCNILPVLLGEASEQPIREATVHHSHHGMFAIRQGKWKLIIGRGSGGFTRPQSYEPDPGEPKGQLYDLELDIAETSNVYDEYPEIVESLTGLLEKYQQTGRSIT